MAMNNSISSLLIWGRGKIEEQLAMSHQQLDAMVDARYLLCHVLDKNLTYLMTWPEKQIAPEQVAQYKYAISERCLGKPVAYIIGYKDFWDLRLKVSPATLIPRADTEVAIEQVLELYEGTSPKNILDLGTGTGALALALAKEFPQARVIASDIMPKAVELAKENAKLNGIANIELLCGSWFEPLKTLPMAEGFDLIVSNPPYIDPQDNHLEQGDVVHEPSSALISKQQGLADIQHIVGSSLQYLNSGAWLLLEHGYDQGRKVRALLEQAGFSQVQTRCDYGNNERITFGKKGCSSD